MIFSTTHGKKKTYWKFSPVTHSLWFSKDNGISHYCRMALDSAITPKKSQQKHVNNTPFCFVMNTCIKHAVFWKYAFCNLHQLYLQWFLSTTDGSEQTLSDELCDCNTSHTIKFLIINLLIHNWINGDSVKY